MTEIELKVFLDVTRNFFEKLGSAPVSLGAPSLRFDAPPLHDFTGLIELGGSTAGFVCITMPRAMLSALLLAVGERASGDVALADMVGEVANIVASNARAALGTSIEISHPTAIMGSKNGPMLPAPTFITPVFWNEHVGHLILALESA